MSHSMPDKVIDPYIDTFTLTADKADSLAVILKNIDCTGFTEMTVYAKWHPGTIGDTLNSLIEFSSDATIWNAEPDESVSGGVGTIIPRTRDYVALTDATGETVPVISMPVADRRVRISYSETAAGSAGILEEVIVRLSRIR